MADLSTSQEVRNASTNGWVDIGKDKCALHVMSKGYLVLQKSEKNGTQNTRIPWSITNCL
jgi:hypothetical protein